MYPLDGHGIHFDGMIHLYRDESFGMECCHTGKKLCGRRTLAAHSKSFIVGLHGIAGWGCLSPVDVLCTAGRCAVVGKMATSCSDQGRSLRPVTKATSELPLIHITDSTSWCAVG
jgi:hypothetical protein